MDSLYSKLSLNSSDIFEFEPDPIQSYDKFTFQRQEWARTQSQSKSTKVIELVIVVVFIALMIIIFLVFLKVCEKSYNPHATRGHKYRLKGGQWIVVPQQNANSGEGGQAETSTGVFVPVQMGPLPMKGPGVKCPKPACVCAVGGNNNKGRKAKGWRRSNDDDEAYGPAKV